MDEILSVNNLVTRFDTDDGPLRAVDDVSFSLGAGETVGIVGESGCGKSVTALSIMGLIPTPPGRVESGSAVFDGRDLLKLNHRELRRIRGNRISMIFQDPMTSLNPFLRIGRQLTEPLETHRGMGRREAMKQAVETLDLVEIPSAKLRVNDYPHQFSGGMRQRVMIAMALITRPALLLADEPTTALDVTIQAQILELLKKVQGETGVAVALITHDLGIVAGVCGRVLVMYAGRIVEKAATDRLFAKPLHPYTLGLLRSLPRLDRARKERLTPIDGLPPDLISPPPGCRYAPRCPFAEDKCRERSPELREIEPGREAACRLTSAAGLPETAAKK